MPLISKDGNTGLIATSPTKEDLENCINQYFFSDGGFAITDKMEVYSKRKDKILDSYMVTVKRGRWRFEIVYDI